MATSSATVTRRHGSPILMLLLGLILVGAFLVGSLIHLETSEAFFAKYHIVSLSPNWAILLQPYQLVTGRLAPNMVEVVVWGWGIELMFLICVVGFEVAHEGVKASSQAMARWFRTGMLVLIAFDGWTDFMYGYSANGFWGQLAFALITSFIVFYFGTIGVSMIEHAIKEFMRH